MYGLDDNGLDLDVNDRTWSVLRLVIGLKNGRERCSRAGTQRLWGWGGGNVIRTGGVG